eukprot:363291-Chlamydomonas_euryale.AAC.5
MQGKQPTKLSDGRCHSRHGLLWSPTGCVEAVHQLEIVGPVSIASYASPGSLRLHTQKLCLPQASLGSHGSAGRGRSRLELEPNLGLT